MEPFNLADENFRLMDINGDGKIDAVYTDTNNFLLYTNLGKSGWKIQLIKNLEFIIYRNGLIFFSIIVQSY